MADFRKIGRVADQMEEWILRKNRRKTLLELEAEELAILAANEERAEARAAEFVTRGEIENAINSAIQQLHTSDRAVRLALVAIRQALC